jgi:hypothetical protein
MSDKPKNTSNSGSDSTSSQTGGGTAQDSGGTVKGDPTGSTGPRKPSEKKS